MMNVILVQMKELFFCSKVHPAYIKVIVSVVEKYTDILEAGQP